MAAASAANFIQSIGINTHLDRPTGGYANLSAVEAALNYLGIKNVRDSFSAPTDVTLFETVAAATGVKFDAYLNTGQTYTAQINNVLTDINIIRFAEGVNEADDNTISTYNGLTGEAAAAAVQQVLYADIHAASSTVKVINYSLGNLADFATAPNTAAYADYGNGHEYWGTGNPPGPDIPGLLSYPKEISGSDPIISGEAGYYTGPSTTNSPAPYQNSGVDQTTQAKYDLTVLFDNWNDGVPVTYLYELMDDVSDPNNTNFQDHYGIFNADGTPKLAATAIKNLISILGSGDNGTKSGDSFGYQLVGAPASGNSLLLEKSNGDFDIAVWNDIRLWSTTSYTAVTNSAVPVTLNFGQLVESVTEYDPLSGSTAVQTWSNVSSISFNLPDHPVIFEVQPYPPAQLSLANYNLPESLSSNQSTANLWSQIIANAVETNPNLTSSLTIKAVSTTGTTGTVSFNAATKSLVYTAPAYNGLNPADSFTYTVSDSAGDTVTGTVAITELPNPNTTYATATGASYTAPSSNWTMVSLATGQSFGGAPGGGDTFILDTDTKVYGQGSNNTFVGGNGNFYVGTGVNNAHVTLGNGNSTIAVSGTGAVITTGNGNNLVWEPTGSSTITMGNGNQQITAIGTYNTVTVGTGTSSISLGTSGTAGYESVTVGGGTNTIAVGGTYDTVHILGGTGNSVVDGSGYATVTVEGGSNTINLQGTNNTITLHAGTNTANVSGAYSSVQGGSGADTIWIGGNNSTATAGTGTEFITSASHYSTISLAAGTDTYIENGGNNTLVLPPASGTTAQIVGNVVADSDKFDLTAALSTTTWNGSMSTLSNYLSVGSAAYGTASTIFIDPDGTGTAAAHEVAYLKNSGGLTYAALVADSILPANVAHTLGLTQSSIPELVTGGQTSGNLWSAILANVIETNASWVSSLAITGVSTAGTAGAVAFNAATQTLTYTAPAYNPLNPTSDSFTYSVSDGHGGTATGTIAVTEQPAPSTTYATTAGATYTATASSWTMVSLATGQSLKGYSGGGDGFVLDTDTAVYAVGNGNTIAAGDGNFYVNAGVNNAHVTLGNGNSTIAVSGTGAVITTGNGNNTIVKPTGSATITTGNGNELITALGANNVISVGTGTSNLNIGTDVTGVGNEFVTVAGGATTLTVGGTGDTIQLLNGTGNIVVSNAGSAAVTVDNGTNRLTIGGASNTITLIAGINTVTTSGAYDTIQGGSGTDSISASGGYTNITAGSGTELIIISGQNDTINLTAGTDTLTDSGGSNTLVLPSTSGLTVQIRNNVVALNDTLDLRAAMAGTSWNGQSSDLANYLGLSNVSGGMAVWADSDGTGPAASHNVAILGNSGYLTYSQLIAHSIV